MAQSIPVTVDSLLAKAREVDTLAKKASDTAKSVTALTKRVAKEEAAHLAAVGEYEAMKKTIDSLVAKGK